MENNFREFVKSIQDRQDQNIPEGTAISIKLEHEEDNIEVDIYPGTEVLYDNDSVLVKTFYETEPQPSNFIIKPTLFLFKLSDITSICES